jgi:hypothetical protein
MLAWYQHGIALLCDEAAASAGKRDFGPRELGRRKDYCSRDQPKQRPDARANPCQFGAFRAPSGNLRNPATAWWWTHSLRTCLDAQKFPFNRDNREIR